MHLKKSSLDWYEDLYCGCSLPPDNPYAVSVHLPTIQDVIHYEEDKDNWRDCMESGYPRFFENKIEKALKSKLAVRYGLPVEHIYLVNTYEVATHICKTLDLFVASIYISDGMVFIHTEEKGDKVRDLIQHAGFKLLPRQLVDIYGGQLDKTTPEIAHQILQELAQHYDSDIDKMRLHNSGVNAMYSTLHTLTQRFQGKKKVLIGLGWLYVDTQQMLSILGDSHTDYVCFGLGDLEIFERYVETHADQIVGVVTEVTTNPHIETPNLKHIYSILSNKYIPLVVDITFATPILIDVSPYCDIVVESLTKFACGNSDVLGGLSVVVNKSYDWVLEASEGVMLTMYTKDAQVLAENIQSYRDRVIQISEKIPDLVTYFESQPKVNKVYWSGQSGGQNFESLVKNKDWHCGVLSIEFQKFSDFESVYNRLQLPKGPSLGTNFTLVMPYFFLAHYQDVVLNKTSDVNPYLLRISVGLESVEELKTRFDQGFGIQ